MISLILERIAQYGAYGAEAKEEQETLNVSRETTIGELYDKLEDTNWDRIKIVHNNTTEQ